MMTKTYKIQGMHCASCAMIIEGELEDAGVQARCSYAKETLDVELDEDTVTEKKIISVVSQAGYSIISSK